MPFETTRWSLIYRAREDESEAAREALEELCSIYWTPLYNFARSKGHSPEDAGDAVQEFFYRLLSNNFLDRLDRDRGRFRSYLLTSMSNFLVNEYLKKSAKKRSPGKAPISLDLIQAEKWYSAEPRSDRTPETVFEREWAMLLMKRALQRLESEHAESGKLDRFRILRPYITADESRAPYAEIGARLGTSEDAAKVAVHRLRGRYRERLREEVANTVANPDDTAEVDDEIRHLMHAVSL